MLFHLMSAFAARLSLNVCPVTFVIQKILRHPFQNQRTRSSCSEPDGLEVCVKRFRDPVCLPDSLCVERKEMEPMGREKRLSSGNEWTVDAHLFEQRIRRGVKTGLFLSVN